MKSTPKMELQTLTVKIHIKILFAVLELNCTAKALSCKMRAGW